MKKRFKKIEALIFIFFIQINLFCNINDLSKHQTNILIKCSCLQNSQSLLQSYYSKYISQSNKNITATAITSDGRLIATGQEDGIVNVIVMPFTRALAWQERAKILALAFSPNDQYLACSTKKSKLLIFYMSPKRLNSVIDLSEHGPAQFISFGLNQDTILTCHQNQFVVIWKYKNNKYIQDRVISCCNYNPSIHITAVKLNKDERSFIVAYDNGSIISYKIYSNHQRIISPEISIDAPENYIAIFIIYNPEYSSQICAFNFLSKKYGNVSSIYVTNNLNYAAIAFFNNSRIMTIDPRKALGQYSTFVDI